MLRKSDFYYGSLLSDLIGKGINPILLSSGETRRIYSLCSNKGDFKVFTKYISNPGTTKKTNQISWQFMFSTSEVMDIRNMKNSKDDFKVALICACSKEWSKSEIAILSMDDLLGCLDADFAREQYQVTIMSKKHARNLYAYGTGKSFDKALKLERDYSKYFI